MRRDENINTKTQDKNVFAVKGKINIQQNIIMQNFSFEYNKA